VAVSGIVGKSPSIPCAEKRASFSLSKTNQNVFFNALATSFAQTKPSSVDRSIAKANIGIQSIHPTIDKGSCINLYTLKASYSIFCSWRAVVLPMAVPTPALPTPFVALAAQPFLRPCSFQHVVLKAPTQHTTIDIAEDTNAASSEVVSFSRIDIPVLILYCSIAVRHIALEVAFIAYTRALKDPSPAFHIIAPRAGVTIAVGVNA
jgi:hypothetical protein